MSKYLASGDGDLFEDDVNDEEFLKNARPGAMKDDRIQGIMQKKKEIENRTLQSTENSLRKQAIVSSPFLCL